MSDDVTVSRWGPEPLPVPPQLAEMWKDVCGRLANSDQLLAGIATVPPGPLRLPDVDEIYRLADQARALRPPGDRLVMASPMYEIVKGFSQSAPQQYGGPLTGLSYGIPIVLDEDMPPNVIEFRDGDRVVKRIEHTAEQAPIEENPHARP